MKHPADFWLRVLSWYCPPSLYEGIEGDILEEFEYDAKLYGIVIAKRRLIWNTLRFFRPGIILRNKFSTELINLIMLTNYLITAYRNIRKSKAFSAINICGLGIGLAACLLIFQFVTFELSYDTFNEKFDRIYRVTNDRFQHGKLIQHGTIMYPTIGPVMARDYPEVEAYTRLMPGGELNLKINDVNHRGDYGHFADEHFLSVFTYPMLAGDKATALKNRYSIVLSERTAKKYFGIKDGDYTSVVGKTAYWGLDTQPYTITGVCTDPPANSHLQFDGLVSYATLISAEDHNADDSWVWSDMRHYLVLKPGADYKKLEAKFGAFSDKYFQGDKVSGSVEKFFLQPLKDAHLYSNYEYDIARTANGKAVWAMLIVALFILLIAWINYINLTTSRAMDRAKEVGLRKVMGALKSQLVKQFIFESIIITALACIVAVVLVLGLQSYFNTVVGKELSLWKELLSLSPLTIATLVAAGIACIVLSGFYPAFILSSYQPVVVLKGKFQRSSRGHFLRKALVVFQFTASAALITGTIIVSQQLSYMNTADLGINIHNTMIVDSPELTSWDSTTIDRIENYKHALTQISGVAGAATSNTIPGNRLGRAFGIRLTDQPSEAHYTMSVMGVDHNFFDTYDVKLAAGRKFLPTDHKVRYEDLTTVVINRNAVKLLGIDSVQDAIGKEIFWGGDDGTRRWTIIGVIGDFHQESLKKPLEAMIFRPVYSTYHPTSIRLKTEDKQKVIAEIENVYKTYFPGNSFQYTFLEDTYKRQYNDDNRFGKVISIFTVLAIIISCLGLIGLSSYTAVQRTKEIGVRKVLGASIYSIVSLLSADFMRLVVIAALLSLPIAYFSMLNWLQEYTYRITLSWLLFVLPVLVVLIIALITISFQVLRAAMTNPADTLKYE
ncbi:MAG TPA: ABC transporter permease [Ohtaekwangia sp.]|uniref:ABC transporter permease n=1 Tax=Ohtaekwangia sp. TaxID=2066019 RepID=UPI002F93F7D6